MSTRRFVVALSVFTLLGVAAACSGGDPYDLTSGSPAPASTGWADPNGDDAAPVWHDAAAWDSGARDTGAWEASTWDSGWGVETGTGWAGDSGSYGGNAGSCSNPICIGDGLGDCGCYATDSQGNAITLGCNGDGCACFVNQQQTNDDVESVDACGSNDETAQAFVASCLCE
jgi:hypothetical protein